MTPTGMCTRPDGHTRAWRWSPSCAGVTLLLLACGPQQEADSSTAIEEGQTWSCVPAEWNDMSPVAMPVDGIPLEPLDLPKEYRSIRVGPTTISLRTDAPDAPGEGLLYGQVGLFLDELLAAKWENRDASSEIPTDWLLTGLEGVPALAAVHGFDCYRDFCEHRLALLAFDPANPGGAISIGPISTFNPEPLVELTRCPGEVHVDYAGGWFSVGATPVGLSIVNWRKTDSTGTIIGEIMPGPARSSTDSMAFELLDRMLSSASPLELDEEWHDACMACRGELQAVLDLAFDNYGVVDRVYAPELRWRLHDVITRQQLASELARDHVRWPWQKYGMAGDFQEADLPDGDRLFRARIVFLRRSAAQGLIDTGTVTLSIRVRSLPLSACPNTPDGLGFLGLPGESDVCRLVVEEIWQ